MTDKSSPNTYISRRTVLKSGVTGALVAGGLLAAEPVSAQQGGVAYLRKDKLRGKNNPDEPRFSIIDRCESADTELPCAGNGRRTFAAYTIRCPNYQGGDGGHDDDTGSGHDDGHDDGHSETTIVEHDDTGHDDGGCSGHDNGQERCGRHFLVEPNRNIRLGGLYVFTGVQDCGEYDGKEYVRAAFRPA